MKKILVILVITFASFSSYAQDPQLFENDWYLQKVIINEVEHLPPFSNVIGRLYLSIEAIEVVNPFCEEGFSSTIVYIPDNNFNIPDGGNVLIGTCPNPEIQNFGIYHFTIYHNLENFISKNPFHYSLISDNEVIILSIINSDGDQAIYANELLFIQSLDNLLFTIYPNPAQNILNIQSQTPIKNIKIYDILGKLILEQQGNVGSIDVSHLANGLLFIKVETDQGVLVKKVVKE